MHCCGLLLGMHVFYSSCCVMCGEMSGGRWPVVGMRTGASTEEVSLPLNAARQCEAWPQQLSLYLRGRRSCRHAAPMDTLGFEPRAFRMRSGCDATTPCALVMILSHADMRVLGRCKETLDRAAEKRRSTAASSLFLARCFL